VTHQRPSGLWVPGDGVNFQHSRGTKRTRTLPSGERAQITIDDSGTVMQILRARRLSDDERLDAVVRPKTVRLRIGVNDGQRPTRGSRR
jgi:hypothetical protein